MTNRCQEGEGGEGQGWGHSFHFTVIPPMFNPTILTHSDLVFSVHDLVWLLWLLDISIQNGGQLTELRMNSVDLRDLKPIFFFIIVNWLTSALPLYLKCLFFIIVNHMGMLHIKWKHMATVFHIKLGNSQWKSIDWPLHDLDLNWPQIFKESLLKLT